VADGLEIRGSTLLIDIFRAYPGAGAEVARRLIWPCAHCGGAFSEPLTMAAIRHRNPPRAVLEAFRALADGGPTEEQIAAARVRVERRPGYQSR
jgi:hypothetical protein